MSAAKQMRLHQAETSEERGRRKHNPPVAALNFKENPPRQAGNLLLKRQALVSEPEKGIKRDLIGNRKDAKRILHRRTMVPENNAERISRVQTLLQISRSVERRCV